MQTENTRAELEAEEARLVFALSAVRTRINKTAPISRLPRELVEYIFSIHAEWLVRYSNLWVWRSRYHDGSRYHVPSKYGHPRHLLVLSAVCRSWRDIALSMGRLWRYIDLNCQDCAAEYFIRSGSSPLSLRFSDITRVIPDLTTMLPHVDRIRDLAFNTYIHYEDLDEVLSPWSAVFPQLTGLSLVQENYREVMIMQEIDIPSVQRLSLQAIAFARWESLCDLTHLLLNNLKTFGPSLSDILRILRTSPRLEYLDLGGTTSVMSVDVASDPQEMVHLPKLQFLAMTSGEKQFASQILHYISLPSHVRLYVQLCVDSLDGIIPKDTHHLGIKEADEASHHFSVCRIGASAFSGFPPLHGVSPWSTLLPIYFQLSRLTTLELIEDSPVMDDDVYIEESRSFLGALPALSTIRIILKTCSIRIWDVFQQHIASTEGHVQFICPSLKQLSCYSQVSLSHGGGILECVKSRARLGFPLETLEIQLRSLRSLEEFPTCLITMRTLLTATNDTHESPDWG